MDNKYYKYYKYKKKYIKLKKQNAGFLSNDIISTSDIRERFKNDNEIIVKIIRRFKEVNANWEKMYNKPIIEGIINKKIVSNMMVPGHLFKRNLSILG